MVLGFILSYIGRSTPTSPGVVWIHVQSPHPGLVPVGGRPLSPILAQLFQLLPCGFTSGAVASRDGPQEPGFPCIAGCSPHITELSPSLLLFVVLQLAFYVSDGHSLPVCYDVPQVEQHPGLAQFLTRQHRKPDSGGVASVLVLDDGVAQETTALLE